MDHFNLNADCVVEWREDVANEAMETLAPLTVAGWHDLPIDGYFVEVAATAHGLKFSVYRECEPLTHCIVCPTERAADNLWPPFVRVYLTMQNSPPFVGVDFRSQRPKAPAVLPWSALILTGPPGEIRRCGDWLEQFHRDFSFAWILAGVAD